jgi:hypothetical protein
MKHRLVTVPVAKRRLAAVLVGVALTLGGFTLGHNLDAYHGAGQFGVTWGTAGGCVVDYGVAHSECWSGDRN